MLKHLLFIYNPTSGTGKIANELSTVLDTFTKAGWLTTVYPTQGKGDAARAARGIASLPGSLEEAVRALEADSVITDALGAHVTEQYLAGKRRECRSYAAQVSQWELEQYLVAY